MSPTQGAAASVAQVNTTGAIPRYSELVPAFIGYTEVDPGQPVRINSLEDFETHFSDPEIPYTNGAHPYAYMLDYVNINNYNPILSDQCYLYTSLKLFFDNGGRSCYVVSCGTYDLDAVTPLQADFEAAFDLLQLLDEPSVIAAPDALMLGVNREAFYAYALAGCAERQDRLLFMSLEKGEEAAFRSGIGTENLKYGVAFSDRVRVEYEFEDEEFFITGGIATISNMTIAEIKSYFGPSGGAYLNRFQTILEWIGNDLETYKAQPPAVGAIIGAMCRHSRLKRIWKLVGATLAGIEKPLSKFSPSEKDDLNIPSDGSGKSINPVLDVRARGIMVFGDRTLAGNSSEWRFLSVRLLFLQVERAISFYLSGLVFEKNDRAAWKRIRSEISAYLTDIWSAGGLAGSKPDEAFSVQVGLGSTMTQTDILEGRMNIEIGLAATRPSEFIILHFSHLLQNS